MKSPSGQVDKVPVSGDRVSNIPAPISETFSHLKNAWPLAFVGFVVGLFAAVIVNLRNRRSGVTTRAQLRATTSTLQSSAVAFESNRMSLAKADRTIRLSRHDMEKHLRNEGASSSMWTVNWHGNIHEYPRKPEYAAGEKQSRAQFESSPAKRGLEKVDQREPGCASERVLAEFTSRIEPPNLPDWFWDRGSSGSSDITQLSAAENTEPVAVHMPSDATSRMERLRGLFANVGLENLHRGYGGNMPQDDPDHRDNSPSSAQTPEILSPREFVPVKEPKRTSDDATSANRGDEIRILPSKRGQYGS